MKTTVPKENWQAQLLEAIMGGELCVFIRTNPNYLASEDPVEEWPEFWCTGLHINSCDVYSLRWLSFTFEFRLQDIATMEIDRQELFITTHPME